MISQKMQRRPDGDWECLECPYSNKTKQRLQYHIESKHIASPGHVCDICLKICPTKNALNLHRSRYHKNNADFYWLIVCFFVDKSLKAGFILDAVASRMLRIVDTDAGRSDWQCSDCDYRSPFKQSLQRHIQAKHISEKSFKCELCHHQLFSTQSALNVHMKSKHYCISYWYWLDFSKYNICFLRWFW